MTAVRTPMPPISLAAVSFIALGLAGVVAQTNGPIAWAVLVSAAVSAFIQAWPLFVRALSRYTEKEATEAETTGRLATHNLDTIEKQEQQIGELQAQYRMLDREVVRLRKINHAIGSAAQGIISHVDLSRTVVTRLLKEKGMSDDDILAILPPPPPMGELVILIRSIDATNEEEDSNARKGLSTRTRRASTSETITKVMKDESPRE